VTTSPRRRLRGFTLVEILVALLVLGVLGGALLELFHGGLRNVALSTDYTRAALLARSLLAQLEARDRFVAPAEEGRFDDRFVWQLRAASYYEGDGLPLPKAPVEPVVVVVDVVWHDGDAERHYTVTSLFLSRVAEDREKAEKDGKNDRTRRTQ
jgi:prepilin-type N-terminal cleavage/methylation domain-containing protein